MNVTKIKIITLTFSLILCGYTFAQTSYTIETTVSNQFSPSQLTIEEGDTVIWKNSSGGLHDVKADDGSFDSGNPSSQQWVYTQVFNQAGTYRYYCSVHGGPGGVRMSGVITVTEPTSVEEQSILPNTFYLEQNYPNLNRVRSLESVDSNGR